MTSEKSSTIKWLKTGGWLIGISFLLFIGLFFLTDWLQAKLERMAAAQSNGLYKLQLHGLEVSPFIGRLDIDSLSLHPDYQRWQQLQQRKAGTPRMLMRIKTGAFSASGLNLLGMAFGKPLQVKRLSMQEPAVLLTAMRPDTTERYKAAHEVATGILKNMQIAHLVIEDASLRYRNNYKDSTYLFDLASFTLKADDFRLDSQSYVAAGRAYYARQVDVRGAGVTYLFPDGHYRLTSDSIRLNTALQTIRAGNIYLKPLRTAQQQSEIKGKAVTSNDLKIKKVLLTGVNYQAYFHEDQVLVKNVLVDAPVLKAYKTRQSGQPEKRKPLPHDLVQQIKTPFLIDTLKVRNGDIRYTELAPAAQKPGYITLNNLNGTITNLSNMPAHISDKEPAVLQSQFMVMNKARVQLRARLPLLNKAGYHTIAGTLGEARPAILNPILVPTTFLKIEEGYIRKGEFEAELTAQKATGSMVVHYRNLEIELLNKGEGGNQGLGKKLISEVADWVAIKDANPMKGEELRKGNISATYDPDKSFLNYWKSCLVSGFLDTIGLENLSER